MGLKRSDGFLIVFIKNGVAQFRHRYPRRCRFGPDDQQKKNRKMLSCCYRQGLMSTCRYEVEIANDVMDEE